MPIPSTATIPLLHSFAETWLNTPYCLWGAGVEGGQALRYLPKGAPIQAVIDSDTAKQGQLWNGFPVLSLDDAQKAYPNTKIAIAGGFYSQLAAMLKEKGLIPDMDFCDWKKLLGMENWARHRKVHSYRLDVSITQRCTLACEKCNMQRAAYKNPADRDLPALLSDLQAYFSCVDFLCEMNILGGEPFLHKDFTSLLAAIGENWRDKIGEIHIFTNGTVLPTADLPEIIRKYGYIIDISDYYTALPRITPAVQRFEALIQKILFRTAIKERIPGWILATPTHVSPKMLIWMLCLRTATCPGAACGTKKCISAIWK